MEGLIIWIAIQKSNTKIKLADGEVLKLFNFISHFGKQNCKLQRTLI